MDKSFAIFGKIVLVVVTLSIVLGGAYYVGSKSNAKKTEVIPTITPSVIPTITIAPTETPTPTDKPIVPTKKISPTKSILPTATPTPTSKPPVNFKPIIILPTNAPTPTPKSNSQVQPGNQNQSL